MSHKIWIDPRLPNASELFNLISPYGAIISQNPIDPSTNILIIHPGSINIFDQYCHPDWLRNKVGHGGRNRDVENWRWKVIVTGGWPQKCYDAGKILGDSDDWGGCRKGGPPARALNLDSDVEVSMNPGYHQPDVSFSDISSDSVIDTRDIRPIASLPIRARRLKTPPDSVDGYSEDETEISGKAKTKTREGGSDVESQQHEKVSMRERENLKGGKSDQSRERGDREKKGKLSKNKAEKSSKKTAISIARLKRFSSIPECYNNHRRILTIEATDTIIRNAHPIILRQGSKGISDVIQYLVLNHHEYAYDLWRKRYSQWRREVAMFENTAVDPLVHNQYLDIYQKYSKAIRSGESLENVSIRMSNENPKFGITAGDWNILFGDWLRSAESDTSDTKSQPFVVKRKGEFITSKEALAKVFKENFDSSDFSASQVVKQLIPISKFAESSLKIYYYRWRAGDPSFLTLPATLRYTGHAGKANNDILFESSSSTRAQKVDGKSLTKKDAVASGSQDEEIEQNEDIGEDEDLNVKDLYSPPQRKRYTEKMRVEDVDEIICHAHLFAVKDDDHRSAVQNLIANNPEYSDQTWPKLYREWRKQTNRFAFAINDAEHTQYTHIFESLFPSVMQGISLSTLSSKLARENPQHKNSTSKWCRLFGHWLRTTELAGTLEGNTPNKIAKQKAMIKRLELATIFKRDYDPPTARGEDVAAELSRTMSSYAVATLESAYRKWRSRHDTYSFIPDDLQPSALPSSSSQAQAILDSPLPNRPRKRKMRLPSSPSPEPLLATKRGGGHRWGGGDVVDLCSDTDDSER